MADGTKMKLTGRVTELQEHKTNKDGVVLARPYVQITMEQVVVNTLRIIADPADLPKLQPLVNLEKELDLPVLMSVDTKGEYAGRVNYRLDVPRSPK